MNHQTIEKEDIVVKFAGDSGDGMQMAGTEFADISAIFGNDLSTFPDYPSEIRAPAGTIPGVSGFQVHIGHQEIKTPGDFADILIAMNPAALKVNTKWLKPAANIIVDIDCFDEKNLEKAGFKSNPLKDGSLHDYNIVKAPITSQTLEIAKQCGLDLKTGEKARNQFALGILFWMLHRDIHLAFNFLNNKFKDKGNLADFNKKVLEAGFHYADTVEAIKSTYTILPLENRKGKFRNITGNVAVAWGLIAAAEKAGIPLFLGSYPITPATEILQELSGRKHLGVKTFQAEDEIAGICSAIGASFAGNLAATSTSGPGLALKAEAMGLAVILELPLIIVNVQRGGPSTGLPTKPEQSDLLQALYGRNGESPCIVMAAFSAADCFYSAFYAAKYSLEHMTPVILLTDGFLAQGSELMKIPRMTDLPSITPRFAKPNDRNFKPYERDTETLSRSWAIPGMEGLRHRVGSLEKEDITGIVSHDPMNHQKMTYLREEKVQRLDRYISDLEVIGNPEGDILAVGWGGSYGAMLMAVQQLQKEGKSISLAQFKHIKPLPKNTREVLKKFKKIVVCELNLGQFASYLRSQFQEFQYLQFNKIQGLPFTTIEIYEHLKKISEDK